MRNITEEARRVMNTRRDFVNYAHVTLSDGTELNLTPSDFRISGNNFTDDWCEGESFQLGSAIGKTATLLLDNTDGRTEEIANGVSKVYPHGKFSEYDFYMAYFQLYLHLPKSTHYDGELIDTVISIGTFTVTTPASHGSTIEIVGVDNMYKFDRDFNECTLDFSATGGVTLLTILNRCCTDCGVPIGYSQQFMNRNIKVTKKPKDVTYRAVVSYIALMAGCNAIIGTTGELRLKTYDMSVFTSDFDGGSFTLNDNEFRYMSKVDWESGSDVGYAIYYDRIRSGRYKVSRIVVEDIDDISTYDGHYRLYEHNSFRDSVNNGTPYVFSRSTHNQVILDEQLLVPGENLIDAEVEVIASNRDNYLLSIGSESGTGSKFSATFYLTPLSYYDGDSADGGTFEPECLYETFRWKKDSGGTVYDNIRWYYTYYRLSSIGPAGKYIITKIVVDDIEDITHFNAKYQILSSTDNGSTYTIEEEGTLQNGENILDFEVNIVDDASVLYYIRVGQDIEADTDASAFTYRQYFKADGDLYLDGDNIDNGTFTSPLGFHNLKSVNGTTISTDDIQFTGVSVSYEEVNSEGNTETKSVHYPNVETWDTYAMEVTENPFIESESIATTITRTVWNILEPLKFRTFSCQSIQDPTIEAGDCAIVYDVKGNNYRTIITNVKFSTGGMTELSCTAEPPLKQNTRYVNPAARAKAKAEQRQDDYNAMVAHFNEIANAALGYYETEVVEQGATIKYRHDQPTLEASTYIVKMTGTGIFISDDGGQSYNNGLDTTTATMLMNLIYVHGLTADWITAGTIDTSLLNVDGIMTVYNDSGTVKMQGGKIVVGSVSTSQLADNAITEAKVNNGAITTNKVANAAITGTKIASTTIDGNNIKTGTIVANNIASNAITADKINANAVTAGKIAANAVTAGTIAANAVTAGKIAANAVTSGTIAANAIVSGKIAANAVTAGTIASNAVTADKINAGAVTAGKLAADAITSKSVTSCTITGGTISGTTITSNHNASNYTQISGGSVVVRAGGDNWVRITDGSETITFGSHVSVNGDIYVEERPTYLGWAIYDAHEEHSSDVNLKKNIEDIPVETSKNIILNARPRYYEFKETHEPGIRSGFIAQELREVLDEFDDNTAIEHESVRRKGEREVFYQDFIAHQTNCIQDLYEIIERQQEEINDLKTRLERLESIVNTMQ